MKNIDKMVKQILSKMTIEEKVGQMCVPILQSGEVDDTARLYIQKYKVGMNQIKHLQS